MPFDILVINPGATSTKIAAFHDDAPVFQELAPHGVDSLEGYASLLDQIPYRRELILRALERNGMDGKSFDAVVGRGGLLAPVRGGVYEVSRRLMDDAGSFKYGEHASNLGPILAGDFAAVSGCKAYVVDPVSTDEWAPVARMSGLSGMDRVCHFHALNHKAVARLVASEMGRGYEEVAFIVAHLGTGVSVGAHVNGRVVDVYDAMNEGTFSIDRAGGVPALSLIDECYSGKHTREEMLRAVNGNGGVFSYLGTKDMREIEEREASGDKFARKVVAAFAYQIAKDIGSMAAVCKGKVDRVIITGGLANYGRLVELLTSYVSFIAPVKILPGEEEMSALASGALRVLRGEETALNYIGEIENTLRSAIKSL
ncbi:MAG: butyrate kinase [Synergistaceae bacterium]|jgi:butyrate kinase|nr:butyrate kinase [Synergistaceae bacterium]